MLSKGNSQPLASHRAGREAQNISEISLGLESSNLSQSASKISKKDAKKNDQPNNEWLLVPNGVNFQPRVEDEIMAAEVTESSMLAELTQPHEYFELFLNEETLDRIVIYTNAQAKSLVRNPETSHMKAWTDVTRREIKAFLAVLIHMGLTSCFNIREYWSKDDTFRIPGIARVMTRDRFDDIKRFIYFNDNTEAAQSEDCLRKLRMIYDSISQACQNHWLSKPKLTIDESMIAFSGDHSGIFFFF